MKRILFLLLLTVSVYGQNPSRFSKIQITGNANSGTATKVNVQEANGVVNTQTINTGFNKNIGLGGSDIVGANTLLNQYSTTPVDWTATAFNSGQVVFYGGKQWIAKIATVAGDVPNSSSKWEEITFESLANKTVAVDQTIIDGSTNAVSGNAVFDGLAGKADISQLHNPVTIGNANGLSLSTQQLSLGLASSGVTGALSGTDWNTFNGKFNTPTGLSTNYLPKWNGSGFGNSQVFDNGISLDYSTNLGSITSSFFSFKDNFTNRIIKIGVNSGTPSIQSLVLSNSAPFTFLINPEGGNTLFGTTTDNGVDKVQVNGNITASPAVSPNQVVVKSQLDAVAGVSGTYTSNGINLVGFNNAFYTIKFIKVGRIVTCHLNGTCNASGSSGAFTFDLPSGFPRFSSSTELVSPAIFQNSTNQIFNAYVKHENTTPNTQMNVVIPSGLSASQNHSFASSFAYYTN